MYNAGQAENQDSRRIIFSKELQYLNTIGKEYEKLAKSELIEILKKILIRINY